MCALEQTHRRNGGQDPGQLYDSITQQLGSSFYQRIDAPASREQRKRLAPLNPDRLDINELAGEPIERRLSRAPGNNQPIGGVKIVARSGWFAARPSGTEDVYKIYAESFRSKEHLDDIKNAAKAAIDRVIGE